ncbi:Ig-like domain-containing protein [Pedobacter montanisoli]|uniref:Ig domain-containing protein n=1 Tax=Pedobacter montanisoli TaxID=2923277 RepID=A0ABS9ZYW2_9SPHI|nr:putative Ig domain-containing protein [Pedobacter montanisoli]MCJ0743511.1 putative Ig domain-containing protein [Pedobacter montanisoli]
MELTSIHSKSTKCLVFYFLTFLLTLISIVSYAQTKVLATSVSSSSHVTNDTKATLDNNEFAQLNSYGGVAVNIGAYNGYLELKYNSVIQANKTSFIKIDFDKSALDALLGGSLGNLLSKLVGGLVLGNHYFEVGAKESNGNEIFTRNSINGFSLTDVKLVTDKSGNYYIAITPDKAYQSVFIRDVTSALLLGTSNNMKVYNAFYYSGTGICDPPFATDYDGTGLTLDVLGVGKAGVTNLQNAIDGNMNTYSEISLGMLGVAGSINQNVYFNTLSNTQDELNITLGINPALVNLGLFNNIRVEAFNGANLVYNQTLSSVLNLDLLGLLNSNVPVTIPFIINNNFDRVSITLSSLLDGTVTQTLRVYEVTRSAPRPKFIAPQSNNLNTCYSSTVQLSATTDSANELIWYENVSGGTPLKVTAYNEGYTTDVLTANKTYYVAARKINCTSESVRVPIKVNVNPKMEWVLTTLLNGSVGSAYSIQLNAATGGTTGYTYAVNTGSSLPPGLSLSTSGLLGGVPTASGVYNFNLIATDNKGCSVVLSHTLKITDKLTISGSPLPDGTVGVNYSTLNIPSAVGGSAPYTYTVTNLPPGLSFNATTRDISGNPTTAGTYTITVNVADADGNKTSMDYTVVIKDPLILPGTNLADGTVGLSYPKQIIPAAEGGYVPYTYSASNLPPGLSFNATTREITGTPTTAGNYTVAVKVTDAKGNNVTTNYTIRVLDPLALPNMNLADGTVGAVYIKQTLPSASGGVGPYTYAASNLPPGLAFNATTREITGTPTQSGNYNIKLTATDAEGRTITNTYTVKVIGVLSLATASLPDGLLGSSYPAQILPSVTGGTGPYIYQAINLPPGFNFNTTTRAITGTPTLGGNFTFSIKVTDANNNIAVTDYNVKVNVGSPVVADVIICKGSAATLTVSNTQNNVTYNWYGPSGNTPLATNNNGTFVTSPINANTTFYVEAVSGTGVSTRTAVQVSVNELPAQAVLITNNPTVNNNQSITLKVNASAGDTINWYNTETGGNVLGTGEEFVTPPLTATTTFYVETVNASGCKSAVRTPVKVEVVNITNNPNCNAANNQISGVESVLCLLCNIQGPGNAVDADKNNFTRISLPVGVVATGYQRLMFQSTGLATDSIKLDLATPVGLLDLDALNSVTINIMKGNIVVKSYALNSSLITLKLLSGNRFTATFAAGADFDRVEIRFRALVSALTSLDIYGAEIKYPKPAITGNEQAICYNSKTTLNAVPVGGTQVTWYSAATGGTILATGNTYETPQLTSSTTYYIQLTRDNCSDTERIPVQVKVVPLLQVPDISANVSSCSGSNVSLAVNNADPAITYNWYTVVTGGTPVYTGSIYTVNNLTANKTYYVEAAQLSCISASRAVVNVTVNPLPAIPQVQASVSSVNAGQTVVLTASSTDTDVEFRWFSSSNSATPIYTGETFVTPPLNSTTSYFVETRSLTSGCVSANRVEIKITVNGGSANPVPCEGATAQSNGVGGTVALLAGVANAQLAIDDDVSTASTLYLPVGLLGGYVYQQLSFPSTGNVGDTVKVMISSPGKLLSLNLLGNIQISSLLQGVSNNDMLSLNNSLIKLELLSGNSAALITYVPTKSFDGIEIRLNGGAVGALNVINLNYGRHITQVPEVLAADETVCLNQTATLKVKDPKANLVYKWYDASGTYQTGKDGDTFVTGTIGSDTKFYVTASSGSGCESGKTLINIKVTTAPVAPDVFSPSISVCTGSNVELKVKDPKPDLTYKWYDNNDVYLADGTSYVIQNFSSLTSQFYKVEAVDNCAVSPRTQIEVKVGLLDPPVITPSAAIVVENSGAVLRATSGDANAVIKWYDVPVGGVALYEGPTFSTPPLTGTKTYYAEVTGGGGCVSLRTSVTITVIPGGNPETTPCGTATEDLGNSNASLLNLGYVYNAQNIIDNNIKTAGTLSIAVGALNTYVYQRVGFKTLSNVGDTVKISISSPGKLLSASVMPAISVLTYSGATSNQDEIFANNPLIHVELLSDNSGGVITFVPKKQFDGVEIRLNSGLVSLLTSLDVNYVQRSGSAPQVEATSLSACEGTTAILNVKNPVAGTVYKWYLENAYQTGKDGVTFSTPSNLAPGTYNFYVTAFANGCESAPTKVVVTILPAPVAPIALAGNPAQTCYGVSVQLGVQQDPNISYNWYDSNGKPLILNSSTYTTPVNLADGIHEFYVEAVNANNCSSNTARTKIVLMVNPLGLASDIQVAGNTNACLNSPVTLTASSTTVTNPVFTWYSDAALTHAEYVGASFTTLPVTADKTYYVTVKGDDRCESSAQEAKVVQIKVKPYAGTSDLSVSAAPSICGQGSVSLTASSTTIQNPVFKWYDKPDLSNLVYTGANFSTPSLNATKTYYVTVQGDNKCESLAVDAKVVTVKVNQVAVAADVTITGTTITCTNNSTTLTASANNGVVNPVFTWYDNAALTSIAGTGAVFKTPALTADKTYYVTVKGDNRCENAASDVQSVTISVKALPKLPQLAKTGTTLCGSGATTLSIENPETGVDYEWYSDPQGNNLVNKGTTYTTQVLTASTDYYVRAVGTLGCSSPTAFVKVSVTVNTIPLNPMVAASSVSTCEGTSASLSVINPDNTVVYNWYTVATGGTPIYTGTTFTTPVVSTDQVYYIEAQSGNCISAVRTRVDVKMVQAPAAPASIKVTDPSVCSGSSAILTVENPVANITYRWYTVATGGTPVYQGVAFTTPAITQKTTFYVESVSSTGGCVSLMRTPVSVDVRTALTAPVVTVSTITQNSILFKWNAVTGALSYDVSINGGVNWVNVTATEYLASGLKPGQKISIVVRALGSKDCETSANSITPDAKTPDPFLNDLYIPNTFTPNNDGKNDIFYAYGNSISKFTMKVYNQWGQLLFESQSILTGWDGTHKGKAQPNGAYVYYIEVTFENGSSKKLKGTITLLR